MLGKKKISDPLRKKYIQPCEIGGSLYVKRTGEKDVRRTLDTMRPEKEDILSSYTRFYRSQLQEMDKIFHRKK
ncbi:MAG: hypothetical protein ABH883_01390 [Candidatus Omnitrophota bacterium]